MQEPQSTTELLQGLLSQIEKVTLYLCLFKTILSAEEAAYFMGISLTTLRHYTSENKIKYYKPTGGLVYFKKEDLIEFLLQNPVEPISAIAQKALKENF